MTENETKLNMVNNHINSFYLNKNNNSLINQRAQFLEQEFKKITNDLIAEKVKSLEYQNEVRVANNSFFLN